MERITLYGYRSHTLTKQFGRIEGKQKEEQRWSDYLQSVAMHTALQIKTRMESLLAFIANHVKVKTLEWNGLRFPETTSRPNPLNEAAAV